MTSGAACVNNVETCAVHAHLANSAGMAERVLRTPGSPDPPAGRRRAGARSSPVWTRRRNAGARKKPAAAPCWPIRKCRNTASAPAACWHGSSNSSSLSRNTGRRSRTTRLNCMTAAGSTDHQFAAECRPPRLPHPGEVRVREPTPRYRRNCLFEIVIRSLAQAFK